MPTTAHVAPEPAPAAMPPPAFRFIPLAQLRESPSNPRKRWRGIEELAESLRTRGQIEPVTVRPMTGEMFELVVGGRRFRAAEKAGLGGLFAVVRELDDREVLEIQIAENNQREDVHPLEEADAFQRLHVLHGESVADIAARIGRPEGFVRQRLRLCKLIESAKQAFLDGKFGSPGIQIALDLARVPEALQKDALRGILAMTSADEAPSPQRVRTYLLGQYTLRLELAPFDRGDSKLVPAAGPCTTCPKRSGNQPELFPEVAAKDTCTDPVCFDQKRRASYEARARAAAAEGRKVLSAKEAAAAFGGQQVLRHDAPFIDLDAESVYDPEHRTWRAIFGKRCPEPVLAQDGVGAAHELVPAAELPEALRRAGAKSLAEAMVAKHEPRAGVKSSLGIDPAAAQAQKLESEATRRAVDGALAEMVTEAEGMPRAEGEIAMRFIVRCILDTSWADTARDVAVRRGLLPPKAKKDEAKDVLLGGLDAMNERQLRGLAAELLAMRAAYASGLKSAPFALACQAFGIDFKAHLKGARKAQKGEARPRGPKAKRGKKAEPVDKDDEEPSLEAFGFVCALWKCAGEDGAVPGDKDPKVCRVCEGLCRQIEEAVLFGRAKHEHALFERFTGGDAEVGEYSEGRVASALRYLKGKGRLFMSARKGLRTKLRPGPVKKFRRSRRVA